VRALQLCFSALDQPIALAALSTLPAVIGGSALAHTGFAFGTHHLNVANHRIPRVTPRAPSQSANIDRHDTNPVGKLRETPSSLSNSDFLPISYCAESRQHMSLALN
jgi:hypothetical protein